MAAVQSWLERGRPILLAALQHACDQIDRELVAAKDCELEAAMPLQQTSDLVFGQTSANASSPPGATSPAAQLTGRPHSADQAPSAPLASNSPPETDDVVALKTECSMLRRKFNALSANFKIAKEAVQKRRDERDAWIQHASSLQRLIAAAEEEHGIRILDRRDQSSRAASHATAQASTTAPRQGTGHVASSADAGSCQAELPPLQARAAAADKKQKTPNIQSDSTQGEADDGFDEQLPQLPAEQPEVYDATKQTPSSDSPVVLSERVVRKKKRDNPGRDVTEPRIKTERANDSSPILAEERSALSTQESIDLGEIERTIATPRKRKEGEQPELEAPKLEMSFATPPAVSAWLRQPPQSAAIARQASVLTPLSVNVRKTRSGGEKPGVRPLKRRLGYAISVLAEDGGVYRINASATRNRDSTSTATPATKRLDVLLNNLPPETDEEEAISSSTNVRQRGLVAVEDRLPIPERRALPFDRSIGQAGRSSHVLNGSTPRPGPPSPPKGSVREQSPPRKKPKAASASSLRSKPPSELQLDDFKINPLANHGRDFAFSEVVRDKAERACLPGCADMHCCGKQFRALALSQRPDPPLTPAQRMEEQRLLEQYLGDQAYKLAVMSREERAQVWVEAMTQELANKYGKHRQRFSRMRSPPGFWDADFPSTQELEAHRAEAARRERQAIAERYREAVRPGGKWLFKDE